MIGGYRMERNIWTVGRLQMTFAALSLCSQFSVLIVYLQINIPYIFKEKGKEKASSYLIQPLFGCEILFNKTKTYKQIFFVLYLY